jgi:hypothetical protein
MDARDYRRSADALGEILGHVDRRVEFERVAEQAVQRELQRQLGHDQSGRPVSPGLYGFLLRSIAKAAVEHALRADTGATAYRDGLLENALNVVRNLRFAFVRPEADTTSGNFWDNHSNPLIAVRSKQAPYIDRSQLEAAVGDYLALPCRSQAVDRFLARVLVAMELCAFADEMLNEETFGLFPPRSPIKQTHALLRYFRGLLLIAVFFGGLVALALWAEGGGLLSSTASGWILGSCGLLFVALTSVSTLALPFAWHAQAKARRNVHKLMTTMSTIYNELKSDGPISAQHIRERCTAAANDGVVWPAPLFALLDDVNARTARL